MDGIRLRLQSSSGAMVSTSSAFGIDGSGANDAFGLIDGGNGFAESLSFLLDNDAIIDSITISQFDGSDAGVLQIKNQPASVSLSNGVNTINLLAGGGGSAHFIRYSGPLTPSDSNGFSVDSITLHNVPEPATAMLLVPVCAAIAVQRGRRRH